MVPGRCRYSPRPDLVCLSRDNPASDLRRALPLRAEGPRLRAGAHRFLYPPKSLRILVLARDVLPRGLVDVTVAQEPQVEVRHAVGAARDTEPLPSDHADDRRAPFGLRVHQGGHVCIVHMRDAASTERDRRVEREPHGERSVEAPDPPRVPALRVVEGARGDGVDREARAADVEPRIAVVAGEDSRPGVGSGAPHSSRVTRG
jgi:hypothetical protein